MMNRLMFVAITAIAGLLLASPLVGLASADCGDKLVGTAWNCDFVCSGGETGEECMEFGHFSVSDNFHMYISGFDGTDGCTCGPKGSAKHPSFDASGTFDCTETVYPSSTQGKRNGNKLTAQYWDFNGESCEYACTKLSSSTCT